MKKITLVLLGGIALALGLTSVGKIPTRTTVSQSFTSPTPESTQTHARASTPVRLQIPKLGIDTQIEQVGMDSDGRMDVPGSSFTVGWWKLGTIPGELGSAVIDGHFDTPQGKPGVFYDLGKLSADDQIIVLDEYGHDLRFAVRSVSSVSDNNFPLEKVFADSSGRRLNLITCSGTWDRALKNYSDRLVVYSELIP